MTRKVYAAFNLAKNLCELILRFDPAMRISAGEIQNHPWVTMVFFLLIQNDDSINNNVLDLMKSYNAERRLRKAMLTIHAAVRLKNGAALSPINMLKTLDVSALEIAPIKSKPTLVAHKTISHAGGSKLYP